MEDALAVAIEAYMLDWSQCATQQDIKHLDKPVHALDGGHSLTFFALLGGMVMLYRASPVPCSSCSLRNRAGTLWYRVHKQEIQGSQTCT